MSRRSSLMASLSRSSGGVCNEYIIRIINESESRLQILFDYPVESDLSMRITISFVYIKDSYPVQEIKDYDITISAGKTCVEYYPTYYSFKVSSINAITNIQVDPSHDTSYSYCPKSGAPIVFYIRTVSGEICKYTCEDWMTWLDFSYSDYNNGDFRLSNGGYMLHRGISMLTTYYEDRIVEGEIYYVYMGSGGS